MRVSNQQLINNYMSDLRRIQLQIATILRQTETGLAFERPRDAPAKVATSLDLHSALNHLTQYNRNIDSGISRLEYTETTVYETNSQLQRVRELTVQASNSYLTRSDRTAIANEMDQLLEHVIGLTNSNFSGRFIYSGFETLTQTFDINSNTKDQLTNSITYRGDVGNINRNIGINRDLDVNFTGLDVFLDNTYELAGRQLGLDALGYNGAFEINDQLFVVTPGMSVADVADMINKNVDAEVHAYLDPDNRLHLQSLNSSKWIRSQDISGMALEDLGLLPLGAYNWAQTGPTLPLTDSRGALDTSTIAFPGAGLTLTTATQDMVLTLGPNANDGFTEAKVLKLDAVTYNTVQELADEIQKKADLAFGEERVIVNVLPGDFIEIETYAQNGTVTTSDLQLGGTADNTLDSFSDILGFTAAPGVLELADLAGVDGNDRFMIDLGLDAYRVTGDETPLDLPAIEINIDATVALSLTDLVDDINDKILANEFLSGLVEAYQDDGRLALRTTKKDQSVGADDLVLANAVGGPVLDPPGTDPWDTLGMLGFYRDPATGISQPPQPATIFGTVDLSGGIAIALGVNDSFTIDLGPQASNDGTQTGPVTLTLTPGVYANAAAIATEITNQINMQIELKNAVVAQVRTVGAADFVDLVTTRQGSNVQSDDLVVAENAVNTLTGIFGAAAPLAVHGGGTAAGQGDITLPHNMIDTMTQIRDELFGYAAHTSRLVDLLDEDDSPLGLHPGHRIVIKSDGTQSEFVVQRFTTMQDFADAVERQLGFQIEVEVLRDGKLQIFNPTTSTIHDVAIEAYDLNGQSVTAFDEKFEGISGKLFYRSELRSQTVYEDERFQRMTDRIGDVDDALEQVLSTLAVIGSRNKRMELTQTQNDSVEINLLELQSENDYVDMAETIIKLQEAENVLRAALGAGSRVIPPTLFDFLR